MIILGENNKAQLFKANLCSRRIFYVQSWIAPTFRNWRKLREHSSKFSYSDESRTNTCILTNEVISYFIERMSRGSHRNDGTSQFSFISIMWIRKAGRPRVTKKTTPTVDIWVIPIVVAKWVKLSPSGTIRSVDCKEFNQMELKMVVVFSDSWWRYSFLTVLFYYRKI